ncbi:type IV secretory system conjugative DNA transfer family protein [Bacillus licheniformis]|uniref:ABC transporter ATP-binding protein n=1 Tax=Bacillus licheniformis TaxID=1402 RepID=UPI001C3F6831|nr:ABC transporter ATP-binding protein [Bacillus licheniformis]MEC2292708.1 ABC transporter ATP-binding protein [Bacillus licheniformis]
MSVNRSKADEKLEEAIESFLTNWRVSLPVLGAGLVALAYWQRDKLLSYIPVQKITTIMQIWMHRLLLFLLIIAVLLIVRAVFVHYWNKNRFAYLQVLPHADDGVKPDTLGEMIRRLHGTKRKPLERLVFGKEWYTFLVHYERHESKGPRYVFYVGADRDKLRSLKHHISSLYSRAEFFEPESIRFPSPKGVGGRMKIRRKKLEANLSLARYQFDQLPGILNVMEPETWMQITFSANDGWKLRKQIVKAERSIKGDKSYRERTAFDQEEMKSYHSRFSGNEVAFDVLVSFASEYERGVPVIKDVGNAVASVMADVNELRYKRWRHSISFFPQRYPYRMVWTGSELANLLHLPHFNSSGLIEKLSDKIPHGSRSSQLLPSNVLSNPNGYPFGHLYHPIVENREVRVLPEILTFHWGLTGRTGSGKSTLLNQIFKSFTDEFINKEKAPGFSFIDPALETAEIILNHLLLAEKNGSKINWDKVHWINFKDSKHPPAMNLLHQMPGESDEFVSDQIMRIIRENNFSVAPQAERLLKKCIQTLVTDKSKKHTILGVRPLLLRPKFLRAVLARLERDPKNQDLISFWYDEAPDLIDTSKHAILNRLDIFYSNDFLRRIFGQSSFAFPVRQWMDEGHIILFNFSGMSEEEIGLIGSYLTYLYYRIADRRPAKPLMHQFCIDEVQRVRASILPEIIAEMRKKGLSLGVSTQTMDKLDVPLQKALKNIAGNMFVCEQGQEGAKVAAEIFKVGTPSGKDVYTFSEAFLKNLPARRTAIKTKDIIDGREQTVFAVVDVPPLDRYKPDGTVAPYDDPAELAISTKWTMGKAKELESKNGLSIPEIDRHIQSYLNDGGDDEDQNESFIENDNEDSELKEKEDASQKEIFDLFSEEQERISKTEETPEKDAESDKNKLDKEWSFMNE